ncbi:type II toxin-antitoxin system PemK/MazF family toxin [Nitratiruptor sp. YY09-18]|uniref:type II toxin-antitoxin system PemK/MazF family toxin n=1 Tax=Nitratiruptor sp. YY09-18 TaxID=2724901 RepID=UPI0019155C9A|nr:type II toxin-antitoxin system PemK/MazF family toxin [Nitratiruptor sp. YY09-18]
MHYCIMKICCAVEVGKVRPAAIVSDTDLNKILDLIIVVALTTNLIDNVEPLHIRITKRDTLKKESDFMVEQIRVVAKDRIYEKIATLTIKEVAKVDYGLKMILGL